jgi:hypothetical protein
MEEEMHMNKFEYTVTTNKSFPEAVEAVEKRATEVGFRVLHMHDLAATLAEKGFPREPLKLIETCNAKDASPGVGERCEAFADAALSHQRLRSGRQDAHQHSAPYVDSAVLPSCGDRGYCRRGRD